MRQRLDTSIAFNLGATARNRATDNCEEICQFEKQRIEIANEPELIERQANLQILSEEREEIRIFLRGIVPQGTHIRQRRRYYFTVAALLGLAGFSFAHLALSPFGLGIYIWFYAGGLAVVCAVLTDMFLEKCGGARVVQVMVAVGLVSSLAGLVILALIRGDVVVMYMKGALSAATSSNASNAIDLNDAAMFYQASARKLQVFFGLLAISMELATGLALWEARKIIVQPQEPVDQAHRRLKEITQLIPTVAARIVFLRNEPLIFEAEFRREYHRGLLQGVERRVATRIGPLLLAALAGFVLSAAARAQTITNVTAIDFSQSDAVVTHGGRTTHQDNIEAAAQHVAGLPPGTRFFVIGITSETFARPLILVAGQIPDQAGPLSFLNRIDLTRAKFAQDVRQVAGSVKPSAATTDVLGSLLVAADIFEQSPQGRRTLVIYSDMRQSAHPVNIENPAVVSTPAAMKTAEQAHLVANLKDVEIFVFGVHAAGKDARYWASLLEFWQTYFTKAGATLKAFTMLRQNSILMLPGKLESAK